MRNISGDNEGSSAVTLIAMTMSDQQRCKVARCDVRVRPRRNVYSGPANDFFCLSDVRTAKIAASVRCFIPIFNKRFET